MREDTIDLYIRSNVGHSYMARDDIKCYNSNMATRGGVGIAIATDIQPRDEDEALKNALIEFTKNSGLELIVHDLADKRERRRALFKGIRSTPVFFYRGMRFHGLPSDNDFSIKPAKVILYIKPEKAMSMRKRIYDHCCTLNLKWVSSTEETYSPGEEKTIKKLHDLESQGRIELQVKDLNNTRTRAVARLRGIKMPSVRIVHYDKRPDTIVLIENLRPNDLTNLITKKNAARLPIKARVSTRYLKWIPLKFATMLGFLFLTLLLVFRLIESRAGCYTEIHDTLWFYVFLLSLLPSISGLVSMLEHYFEMRISETMLIRYLRKLGVYEG